MPRCKHHTPFEDKCQLCVDEGLAREAQRPQIPAAAFLQPTGVQSFSTLKQDWHEESEGDQNTA